MANVSSATRKELVLRYLEKHRNEWVDGPDLANAQVGGSEGLKRVRELRADGHRIITRPHPDRTRDIFQYKLVVADQMHPVVQDRLDDMIISAAAKAAQAPSGTAPQQATPLTSPEPPLPSVTPGMAARPFLMKRTEDGTFELTKEVCVECGGLYDDDIVHRQTDPRHLRWVENNQKFNGGQLTIGVPEQPAPYKFHTMPTRIDMSTMMLCPRCGGKRRLARTWFSRKKGEIINEPAEEFTRDPYKPTIKGEPNPCPRCGGFGVVPQFVEEQPIEEKTDGPTDVLELPPTDTPHEVVD